MDISSDFLRSIFTPWVMRSAWYKTLSWYRTGEWYDPGELLTWKADPWAHLAELADDLVHRNYRPQPFPLVPYPKKEDVIRHYAIPSVRDQVAFMAFLVLLGPFLEAKMSRASFGNRLFRPRVLREPEDSPNQEHSPLKNDNSSSVSGSTKRWYRAPFSLSHDRVYESFAASYGLFRRVCQWIINAHIWGSSKDANSDTKRTPVVDSDRSELSLEDPDALPYLRSLTTDHRVSDLVHARIDLSLAYPSVDRKALRKVLSDTLSQWSPLQVQLRLQRSGNPFGRWFESPRPFTGDHPWQILSDNRDALLTVAEMLMDALDQVTYAPWDEPESWNETSKHVDHLPFEFESLWQRATRTRDLKCDKAHLEKLLFSKGTWPMGCHLEFGNILGGRFGLPTGLAISGLLLNVALTPLDNALEELCAKSRTLYYLRYVDDMVLIATGPQELQEGLQTIHQFVSIPGKLPGCFKLNSTKAKPEAVKSYLSRLCDAVEDETRLSTPVLELSRKDYITRCNAEIFTTGIVRELSELADEAFDERFGAAGIDRLEQLIALASISVDDIEVAKDARLSFAVNQIARSSWNEDAVAAKFAMDETNSSRGRSTEECRLDDRGVHVSRLLWVAEQALCQHPWRAKLWRAILIMAVRAATSSNKKLGRQWLEKRILPLLRWDSGTRTLPISDLPWGHYDPSLEDEVVPENIDEIIRSLGLPDDTLDHVSARRSHHYKVRASYHRACFWRQWVGCVEALRIRLATGRGQLGLSDWTAFMSDSEVKEVLEWLGGMEGFVRFASILYGTTSNGSQDEKFLWWWEAEAIHLALLSVVEPAVALLKKLEAPKPNALRRPLPELVHLLVQEILPHHPELQVLLTQALSRVLLYLDAGSSRRRAGPGRQRSLLWLAYYHGEDFDGTIRLNDQMQSELLPGPYAPFDWAAMARLGLLDRTTLSTESALVTSVLKSWLPRIGGRTHEPKDPLWRALNRLDAYHHLRRHFLGIGKCPKWENASQWLGLEIAAARPASMHPPTLFETMFCLDDRQTPLPPSDVPALETDVEIALQIGKEAIPSGGFIAPGTVRLHEEASKALNDFRRTLLSGDDLVCAPDHRLVSDAFIRLARLANGQLGVVHSVNPLHSETPAPHAIFLLPSILLLSRDSSSPFDQEHVRKWQGALLALWLASGGEHILDSLYHLAPWQPPLSDRSYVRSSLLFPEQGWKFIEEALGSWGAKMNPVPTMSSNSEPVEKEEPSARRLVDITIADDGSGWYRKSFASSAYFDVSPDDVETALRVRILQAKETPNWSKWLEQASNELATGGTCFLSIARELADFLYAIRAHSRQMGTRDRIHLALLPECYVPWSHLGGLRQFVRETGVALLAGILVRELPRSVHIAPFRRHSGYHCIVNEAVLIMPSPEQRRGRPLTEYVFRIRKPYASSIESGLVKFLSLEYPSAKWRFVPGTNWFRFRFPKWGYFSVAICSDLLDTFIWNWLRGRIQHLFVLSWNPDIDLFDQLSWTRSYELYANVVTVNHGDYGGSIAWTPKSRHDKEIFRTHGRQIALDVTISIPLQELVRAQRFQLASSVEKELIGWAKEVDHPHFKFLKEAASAGEGNSKFKAPPPGYPRFDPKG